MHEGGLKLGVKFGIVALLYLCVILILSYLYYLHSQRNLLQEVDEKLTTAIHSTRAIIGHDFHDDLVDESSITSQQDYHTAVELYQYAQQIGVAYLYSFKKFDDDILFVISSATEEELALETYEPAYYTKYPEMDVAVSQAFASFSTQSAEYHDRWGSFRSVFIPFNNNKNEIYVMGADIEIEKIEAAAFNRALNAYLFALLMVAMIAPMMLLWFRAHQHEWQLKFNMLYRDELTGLPNQNQLNQDLAVSKQCNLALLEINQFSDILNTYGPIASDTVLREFANRLSHFCHPSLNNSSFYHINGGVFAVLENQSFDAKKTREVALFLIKYLASHKYRIDGENSIDLSVTVGGVNQKKDALMLANMALEEAKRKHVEAFAYDSMSSDLPASYQRMASIKQQIQLALEEGRLVPFYQPIYRAEDRKLAKYECLARIVDAAGEVVLTPDLFIPVARRTRQYSKITQTILQQSIKAAQQGDFIISINLSVSDIMNNDTRKFIFQSVKESKIANRIQFEILENEAIEDLAKIKNFIIKLQLIGARVGIDDLGRSYSNFDRLSLLPVDFIKIDGFIITAIEKDEDAQAVTKDIVRLAHKQNIKVTAEYCYNQATTEMAVKLGVDFLQGFYLGKPFKRPLNG